MLKKPRLWLLAICAFFAWIVYNENSHHVMLFLSILVTGAIWAFENRDALRESFERNAPKTMAAGNPTIPTAEQTQLAELQLRFAHEALEKCPKLLHKDSDAFIELLTDAGIALNEMAKLDPDATITVPLGKKGEHGTYVCTHDNQVAELLHLEALNYQRHAKREDEPGDPGFGMIGNALARASDRQLHNKSVRQSLEKGLDAAKRSTEFNRAMPSYWNTLADILIDLKRFDEARAAIAKSREIDPNDTRVIQVLNRL